ncbi:MAG: hypothetical protein MRY57_01900 [Candidatus Pacebacteria bacterium]|nr:hypothetical protein [Candidatus Paceibacterota bacterium]
MFSKVYKYIGIFVIALVLLGHHSLQAQAMGNMHHASTAEPCDSTECHHEMNMEICEKIQSDEIQVQSQFFTLPNISNFVAVEIDERFISFPTFENIYERIPISYQQLARSHL